MQQIQIHPLFFFFYGIILYGFDFDHFSVLSLSSMPSARLTDKWFTGQSGGADTVSSLGHLSTPTYVLRIATAIRRVRAKRSSDLG